MARIQDYVRENVHNIFEEKKWTTDLDEENEIRLVEEICADINKSPEIDRDDTSFNSYQEKVQYWLIIVDKIMKTAVDTYEKKRPELIKDAPTVEDKTVEGEDEREF